MSAADSEAIERVQQTIQSLISTTEEPTEDLDNDDLIDLSNNTELLIQDSARSTLPQILTELEGLDFGLFVFIV
jgi:hypothetical protein